MAEYGSRSRSNLETAHRDLQKLFNIVILHYDCSILEGHRGEFDQNKYYDEGKSKLQWPASKHNKSPSLAVDAAPYPIDWRDEKRFYHFAGFVKGCAAMMGLKLRWGGDWDSDNDLNDQTFMDLCHFEITGD